MLSVVLVLVLSQISPLTVIVGGVTSVYVLEIGSGNKGPQASVKMSPVECNIVYRVRSTAGVVAAAEAPLSSSVGPHVTRSWRS